MATQQKPIKISLCTPVHNDGSYVIPYVKSVLDQDLDDWELILVENGSTDDSWVKCQEAEKLDEKGRIRAFTLPNVKNACLARNFGYEKSTGKFVAHPPADCVLFPGTLRTWIESLEEFPEYDFLYGGYKFGPPLNQTFFSEGYNDYTIQKYNYIDGSFPYKREFFVPWDPNIKSLQDWDFWLNMILTKKAKGLYRPEIFFETVPPHEGGLSYDSAAHWLERVKQIRSKYGLKEDKICVVSPGAPFHAINLAKILDEGYSLDPSFKPNEYEMIYLLGFYPSLGDRCARVFRTAEQLQYSGKKVIHWVGSDVMQMLHLPFIQLKQLVLTFKQVNIVHLVEFEQTQKELAEIGIEAEIVPLPPKQFYELTPLPKKFTVACYLPEVNESLYYPEFMEKLTKEMTDVSWIFFGNRGRIGKHKNVEFAGHVDDMAGLIKQCSAIVRFTQHDGLPLSLVEFKSAGRQALFNLPLPYMESVNSFDVEAVKKIIYAMKDKPLDKEGAKYWRELCSPEKYKEKIMEIFNRKFVYEPETYWEARADSWNRQAVSMGFPHEAKIKELIAEVNPKSVIDLGCGNARWVRLFEGIDYYGIDISQKLVEIAKTYYPDKKFEVCKVEDLPEGHWDLGFSYTCLEHIKDAEYVQAIEKLKKQCDWLLLIEPINFQTKDYSISHDYEKDFNVVKKFDVVGTYANANNEPVEEKFTIFLIKNG